FDQLPSAVQTRLHNAKDWPSEAAKQAEGKWPDYAVAVMEFLRTRKLGPIDKQLGPSRPAEFSPSIRQFIEKQLVPVLSADELARLKKFEGRWPGYPRQVLLLAPKHGLQVPGMGLPGPR